MENTQKMVLHENSAGESSFHSPREENRRDEVTISRTEYERLKREAAEGRVGSELTGAELKIMNRVVTLPLPEGKAWEASTDSRSMRRFLSSNVDMQRLSGLDSRATFFY
jgi:hypothetical protein